MNCPLTRYAGACALGVIACSNVFAASGMSAVDQRGADLGIVVSTPMGGSQAIVAMEVNAKGLLEPRDLRSRPGFGVLEPASRATNFVELLVTPDGITHPYAPYVYYASPTCRGVPYISAAASRLAADLPAAVAGEQVDLYVATSRDPIHIDAHSVLTANGCQFFNHTVNVLPALWTMNLNNTYVFPIHW